MTHRWGNTLLFRSSNQLPCSTLSQTLNSPCPELQTNKDTVVRCAALGAEVPGQCQEQLTQTLIVRL